MLSIDEAIKHCRHTVYCLKNDTSIIQFGNCIESYEQLAEWLEELKSYRENSNGYTKEDIELNRKAMYNKAIDDFVNACKEDISCQTFGLHTNGIERIAEQLKAGVQE